MGRGALPGASLRGMRDLNYRYMYMYMYMYCCPLVDGARVDEGRDGAELGRS